MGYRTFEMETKCAQELGPTDRGSMNEEHKDREQHKMTQQSRHKTHGGTRGEGEQKVEQPKISVVLRA